MKELSLHILDIAQNSISAGARALDLTLAEENGWLPLLRLAAEQTGGQMKVDSRLGEGTTVTAAFDTASIDCPPLGDMPGTVSLLVQGAPEGLEITYTRSTPKGGFRFDTRQVREILGPDVPLSSPDVAMWVRDFVAENEAEIT